MAPQPPEWISLAAVGDEVRISFSMPLEFFADGPSASFDVTRTREETVALSIQLAEALISCERSRPATPRAKQVCRLLKMFVQEARSGEAWHQAPDVDDVGFLAGDDLSADLIFLSLAGGESARCNLTLDYRNAMFLSGILMSKALEE